MTIQARPAITESNLMSAEAQDLTIDELMNGQGDFTVLEDEEPAEVSVMAMLEASIRLEQERKTLEAMREAVRKQENLVHSLILSRPTRF